MLCNLQNTLNFVGCLAFVYLLYIYTWALAALLLVLISSWDTVQCVEVLKCQQCPCVTHAEIQLKRSEEVSRQVILKSFLGGDICFSFRVPIITCVFQHDHIFSHLDRLLPRHTGLVTVHKHTPLPKLQRRLESHCHLFNSLEFICIFSMTSLVSFICSLFLLIWMPRKTEGKVGFVAIHVP